MAFLFKHAVLVVLSVFVICIDGSSISRIIGGSNVDISEHPWQASLQLSGSHICGASFIHERWLVTAAHCVNNQDASQLSIGYGDSDRTRHKSVPVLRYVKHPDYMEDGNSGYPNDIAVLELAYSVTFDTNTDKIPLPKSNSQLYDCTITGWGCYNMFLGIFCQRKDILQGTSIAKIDADACKGLWSETQIQDMHVCVHEDSKSGCSGDSGGPLSCMQDGGRVLAGATSWGSSSCSDEYPTVYARVSTFVSWIRETTGLNL